MLAVMERNVKVIEHEIASICFYMQGGVSYEDAHLLSASQRKTMSKIVEKHFEAMSGKTNSRLI